MDQEVIRRRNTVFTVIYRNLATHYAQYVPQAARLLVEVIFLIMVRLRLLESTVHVHNVCTLLNTALRQDSQMVRSLADYVKLLTLG